MAFPVVTLLWAYFLYLSADIGDFESNQADQTSLLGLTSVVLAVTALFTGKGFLNWRYSKKLIARLVLAVFLALVLYEALALLLQAAAIPMYLYFDFLYSYLPDIGENYSWIATLVAATTGVLIFLSRVPVTRDKNAC